MVRTVDELIHALIAFDPSSRVMTLDGNLVIEKMTGSIKQSGPGVEGIDRIKRGSGMTFVPIEIPSAQDQLRRSEDAVDGKTS